MMETRHPGKSSADMGGHTDATCRRCVHHRRHRHHRNTQCRPNFFTSTHDEAANMECFTFPEKSNKSGRHQREATSNHTNAFQETKDRLKLKKSYHTSPLVSNQSAKFRQLSHTNLSSGEDASNSTPPHNFFIGSASSLSCDKSRNPLDAAHLSFSRESDDVPKRLDVNQMKPRNPFKYPEKKKILFTLRMMIGLVSKIALLTFISSSVMIFPPCRASLQDERMARNGTQFEERAGGGHSGESNFHINSSPAQWLGESPTATGIYKNGGDGAATSTLSSHPPTANGISNSAVSTKDNSRGDGDSEGNVRTPHLEEAESKMSPSPSKRTKEENTTPIRLPFVRAHSTGFISLVEGEAPTIGSAFSSMGAFTGGKLQVLAPQLVGGVGDENKQKLLKVGSCLCWNTTDDGHKREVECKCTGQEMTNVSSSLPSDIHRLTVEQAANFTTLSNEDLKPYGKSLSELVLTELATFQTLKNGTFLGMRNLNTIYVHGAPALTQIEDGVFRVYLPELKIIRITHSSLEVVPNLSKLNIKKDAALHMVELENNKISRLIPGSFEGLVTEHLALSYNDLEEIGPFAFQGATIARLTLKGNPLKTLHPNSFVGIDSLRVLDLSETQITYLPTHGLRSLEKLRLEKVWTLSVIPSIYHFQELQEAWLTWPYHCCAFEFPETHDPVAFQHYTEHIRRVVNDLCAKASANASTEPPDKHDGDIDSGGSSASPQSELSASVSPQRQKRHLRLVDPTNRMRGISSSDEVYGGTPSRNRRDRDNSNWNNRNTQILHSLGSNIYNNIVTGKTMDYTVGNSPLPQRWGSTNEPMINPNSYAHRHMLSSAVRLRKRSANGHHPRQAQQRNGAAAEKNDEKVETEKNEHVSRNTDGFHHPHVHYGNNGNFESDGNPSHHHNSFEDDDGSSFHYEKMGHEDSFDPFAFDPDQSFAPILDPHDLEHDSDILGRHVWGTLGQSAEGGFDEDKGIFHPSVTPSPTVVTLCGNVTAKRPFKIACHPQPDAFNPCEDIMGSIWLRGAVWVVVALALFGNTAVLVVLLLAPGRISVQRFLMANLSWADLCMGLYLLMVATQDLVSLGSYFNYAIDWQLGWGCQIAGFLTVFASELSVFTLAVITGERWYALTRAIHLTKRLTLFGAAQLMALGWFMAILLAALPLMGVSSYSKTSICLPMEASSGGAVAYLIFLLLFNGVAFLLVACAYWQMYRAVAGHGRSGTGAAPAASSADTAIAKKMALLVFTDFACWAPVAFFGLTAVGGFPLIGVTDSKILLVFFYPLNACCNPYLYAILTKQYRRDLLLLLSRHGMCTKRAARYKTGAASTNNTMQTMQTVLRMGSMTETKVAGSSGTGRGSLLNGGRLSSVAGNTVVENLEEQIGNPASGDISSGSSSQEKYKNNLLHSTQLLKNPTTDGFRKGADLKSSTGDEDDDVFDINGLDGRHIAETTFISVPVSTATGGSAKKKVGESPIFQNGDPAKEKLIQHQVEHHQHHSNNKTPTPPSPCSAPEKLTPDHNNSASHLISLSKDEQDLDHEISETTPFCSVRS